MHIALDIPDELAPALTPSGVDPSRAALEALGLEAYRQRRMSGFQLRTMLGFTSRWDLEDFLREHKVYDYAIDDFEKDLATIQGISGKTQG